MGFYYFSLFSWMAFGIYFAIAAAIIITLCNKNRLSKYWKAGLLAVAFVAPWTEELWIAYNFGQLCRKDAGIVIKRTVEVEGFYDATRPTHAGPRSEEGAKDLDRGGYRFYEMVLPNNKGGPSQTVHLEKVNDVWTATVLDKPAAKYHYTRNIYGEQVAHKITRQEARVTDSVSGAVVGRYIAYSRDAYWGFIHLSAPRMGCDGPDMGPNTKHSSLIYAQVLKPLQLQK